jgi:hypothetical protein
MLPVGPVGPLDIFGVWFIDPVGPVGPDDMFGVWFIDPVGPVGPDDIFGVWFILPVGPVGPEGHVWSLIHTASRTGWTTRHVRGLVH